MTEPRILRIYIQPDELKRARDGKFGIMTKVKNGFEWAGFRVEFLRDSVENREKAPGRRGYALYHMQEPNTPNALNLRRTYYYPFWRIESSNRRWNFDVAKLQFTPDPDACDPDWAKRWRRWLFKNKAERTKRDGSVYVPLQGRLLEHRSFQSMSPLQMLDQVLDQVGGKPILVGLHPGETYEADEIAALGEMEKRYENLTIQTGGSEEALRVCDFVVTQNSSVALAGFFFHKPAILFGKIDFHHIALNIADLGVNESFARVGSHDPAYDCFLHWFIQEHSIKADEDNASDKLVARCKDLGWSIEAD